MPSKTKDFQAKTTLPYGIWLDAAGNTELNFAVIERDLEKIKSSLTAYRYEKAPLDLLINTPNLSGKSALSNAQSLGQQEVVEMITLSLQEAHSRKENRDLTNTLRISRNKAPDEKKSTPQKGVTPGTIPRTQRGMQPQQDLQRSQQLLLEQQRLEKQRQEQARLQQLEQQRLQLQQSQPSPVPPTTPVAPKPELSASEGQSGRKKHHTRVPAGEKKEAKHESPAPTKGSDTPSLLQEVLRASRLQEEQVKIRRESAKKGQIQDAAVPKARPGMFDHSYQHTPPPAKQSMSENRITSVEDLVGNEGSLQGGHDDGCCSWFCR